MVQYPRALSPSSRPPWACSAMLQIGSDLQNRRVHFGRRLLPAAGFPTVSSTDPSRLLVSASDTAAGQESLTSAPSR